MPVARPGSAASRYRCAWKSCPLAITDALAGFTLEYTCMHTANHGGYRCMQVCAASAQPLEALTKHSIAR